MRIFLIFSEIIPFLTPKIPFLDNSKSNRTEFSARTLGKVETKRHIILHRKNELLKSKTNFSNYTY